MIRKLLVVIPALLLGGCLQSLPGELMQARSPCRSEPGKWCPFVRDLAEKGYQYAQLATNAYDDEDRFAEIASSLHRVQNVGNDKYGLAYAIFDRVEDGRFTERIIAFRGTEFTESSDWFFGNIGETQLERGQIVYSQVRSGLDQHGDKTVKITVTGHSLGGAIATQISLANAAVDSYVFNSSPHYEFEGKPQPNRRYSYTERGEILHYLRQFKQPPEHDALVINCWPGEHAFGDHSIRRLAECLTWIAAYQDKEAYRLVQANHIEHPPTDTNLIHPGPISGTAEDGTAGDGTAD